jgi:hypothetical protein
MCDATFDEVIENKVHLGVSWHLFIRNPSLSSSIVEKMVAWCRIITEVSKKFDIRIKSKAPQTNT